MSLVKFVGCCLLVVFLVTGDQINADVQTFHQMLANFSTGHHLPTQANLTSDGHIASDTLVKDMKSRNLRFHPSNWATESCNWDLGLHPFNWEFGHKPCKLTFYLVASVYISCLTNVLILNH